MSRRLFLPLLAAAVPLACAGGPAPVRQAPPPAVEGGTGALSVRLEVLGGPSARMLELDGVLLVGAEREIPLPLRSPRVALAERDRELAAGQVPSGHYRGLRVILRNAWSGDPAQGGAELLLRDADSVLVLPFDLRDGATLDLLLTLDLRRPEPDGISFRPRWTLGLAGPLLPAEMLLCADGRSSGLVVVDRKRWRVHRTLFAGQAITGLGRGRTPDELFAIDAGLEEAILLDLARGEERDRRGIQAGARASWAAPLPDGRGVAIAMAGRRGIELLEYPGFLSVGSLDSGRPVGRMASGSALGRLYALLPDGDEVLAFAPATMAQVGARVVEDEPVDLDLDRAQGRLAVACAGTGRVLILDASSLEVIHSVSVGIGLSAVQFDDRTERLFAATSRPPQLHIVDLGTGQPTFRATLPSPAADLELDPDGRLLWAACPAAGQLVAFDRFTLRLAGTVEVPGAPDRLLAPGRRIR